MDRQLIGYLPPVVGELREMKALMAAEQSEAEGLWDANDAALADQFVTTAGDGGLKRSETMLGLHPKATATLDERRFAILARLSEIPPFTITVLRQKIAALCGSDFTMDVSGYTLRVRIFLTSKNSFEAVAALLRRMTPANMAVDLSLKYNPYSMLAGRTHASLAAYTYNALRNEVLSNA